ncbi:hypothetical protein HYH02_001536 [Chlamydomonas schloesseri]|uniref:Uncharacterized protein n=1 Tax=Chlamydomonas schloesseri TaxID=2026947 RepID=A0A835WST6_9CHLO|nr:hypothetical protein HYH02_001536 [Chlamydomonas schloesseri]|eukprot:KAG2453312.1 hypothetical protein HYH02_001536 [Chlamydomonas schloesseri]
MERAQSSEADVSSRAKVMDEGSACSGVRKPWERQRHTHMLSVCDGCTVVFPFDSGGSAMVQWGWYATLMMAGCAA